MSPIKWSTGAFGTVAGGLGDGWAAECRGAQAVLVKPNLIAEDSRGAAPGIRHLVTDSRLVGGTLDWLASVGVEWPAVVVADAPQTDSDFGLLVRRSGLDGVVCARDGVRLIDLRRTAWLQRNGVTHARVELPGDPQGYTTVDLGGRSEFADYALNGRFYGADYDYEETRRFHSDGRHECVLCRTALDADVIINVPKLKTHKKTGVTLGLKNMVGVNGYRNCLPHFTMGTPAEGGDELPDSRTKRRLESATIAVFKRAITARGGVAGRWARAAKRAGAIAFGDTPQVVRSGNWYGNETAWRMVLDLNRIIMYYDGGGRRLRAPRRMLTVVDGIVGMDGDGPVAGDPVESGIVVAGLNCVAVDAVCATLMGFDWRKIPMIREAWNATELPLADFGPDAIECVSNVPGWNGSLADLERAPHLGFRPHFGWVGHIERPDWAENRVGAL